MLALLAALAVPAQIPVGCYGMPELCNLLTQATGVVHLPGQLRDYPVFVCVKSGDPKRVETLVATALRSEWDSENGKLKLFMRKAPPNDGYEEFQRLYLKACGKSARAKLPAQEIYATPPGKIIRFSHLPNPFTKPLPPELDSAFQTSQAKDGAVLLRRMGYGMFMTRVNLPGEEGGAFSEGGDLMLSGLPQDVQSLLAGDLTKPALSKEETEAVGSVMKRGALAGLDWKHLDKRDPVAVACAKILMPASRNLDVDVVMQLPDLMPMVFAGKSFGTVADVLNPTSSFVVWKVVDGAAVGLIPPYSRDLPTQASRDVVQQLFTAVEAHKVVDLQTLSAYVADQNPAASESWDDAMFLALSGLSVDEEFIGEYPFNERLFTKLTPADWKLIRSKRPFSAASLSGGAQEELADLLLNSMSRLEDDKPDPAFWKSLNPSQLVLTAEPLDEPVLVRENDQQLAVEPLPQMAADYQNDKENLKAEPLYRAGIRHKVTLTIACIPSQESVETGFSAIDVAGSGVATTWDKLPPAFAAQFKQELAHSTYAAPDSVATGAPVESGGGTKPPR